MIDHLQYLSGGALPLLQYFLPGNLRGFVPLLLLYFIIDFSEVTPRIDCSVSERVII